MRTLPLLLLPLLTACAGTFLTEIQTGYALAPVRGGPQHAGAITGHVGGSSGQGLGIGVSARGRVMDHGFAFPEVGPHGFLLIENDGPVAFYTRLNAFVGLAMLDQQLGPVFSGVLNPGVLVYPADDPLFLSFSLTGEVSLAPVGQYSRGWLGVQIGIGAGGRRD